MAPEEAHRPALGKAVGAPMLLWLGCLLLFSPRCADFPVGKPAELGVEEESSSIQSNLGLPGLVWPRGDDFWGLCARARRERRAFNCPGRERRAFNCPGRV